MMRYLLPIVCLMVVARWVCAQPASDREPWQPQTLHEGREPDPRLLEPVRIEILGRAATPALELLSGKTGVELTVDPRYRGTIGERKLTIIAQDCSLKAIMVQLQEALQECYWAVDWSSEQPTYTLLVSRQAADHRKRQQQAEVRQSIEQTREAGRAPRQARLDAVREAFAMSPEELKRLEKDDLLLARALRHPELRANIAFILSLPQSQLDQLVAVGGTSVDLRQAPERLQEKARANMALIRQETRRDSPTDWRVTVMWGEGPDDDLGAFSLYLTTRTGGGVQIDYAIPSRWAGCDAVGLLAATGTDRTEAEDIVRRLRKAASTAEARSEARRRRWRESGLDPDTPVRLPSGVLELAELQHAIAEATGLSLISDSWSFALRPPSDAASSPLPVWRLFAWLEDKANYVIQKVGTCLVLHRQDWEDLRAQEIPESLLAPYAEQLAAGRELSAEDVFALCLALGDRPVRLAPDPEFGSNRLRSYQGMLAFYEALTPEQQAKVCSPSGLLPSDLTEEQEKALRRFALDAMGRGGDAKGKAALRVSVRVMKDSLETRASVRFSSRYQEWHDSVEVDLLLPAPRPRPPAEVSTTPVMR